MGKLEPTLADYLNIRGAYAPSFSPSGARIAFLSDITGVPQVWAVGASGGWPDQLTFFEERISTVDYSPTSDALVFSMDQGGNELHQLYLIADGGLYALTAEPSVMNVFGAWAPDGKALAYASNRRNFAFYDIYVQGVPEGKPRLVYQQDGSNSVVAWSPDGRYLVLSRAKTNLYNDLYLLDLRTGKATALTPEREVAAYLGVQWASEGKGLYLATNRDREFKYLAHLDLASKALRTVAEYPWDVEGVALSRDGRRLAYSVNEEGYSKVYVKNLITGAERPVVGLPPCTIRDARWTEQISWASDGRRLAFTINGAASPSDVWTYDVFRQSLRRATHSATAGISPDTFVQPQLVHFATFDGRRIPAWLYAPTGARPDGTNRVVIEVHGGPEAQERPIFTPVFQYLASRGYCVVAPNVRGSTGYGRTYVHLDDVRQRTDAVKDIKHLWQWLVESKWAHPKRVAIWGASYGGFMTLASITTYPELWAAAVDVFGIANFITFLQNTSAYRRKLRAAEYGDPERDADFLREISPIHHIDRIRAPLLAVHGVNDPRVPIDETEQIVRAVKERGGIVEYMRFEDEGHGIVKKANRLRAYSAIADFLDRHLKGP